MVQRMLLDKHGRHQVGCPTSLEYRITIKMGWARTTLAASTAITSFAPEVDGGFR